MYKVSKDATTSLFGWGVQLSGTIKCCDWFRLFMNGVYGEGITQEQAEEAKRRLEDKLHSDVEITLVAGGQPVYYFIVSVE